MILRRFSLTDSAIGPLGGELLGYKGYGLTLFSELWTMALAQYGRNQGKDEGDANCVWVQVIDPSAFGEQKAFITQVDELIRDTLAAKPIAADNPVRIPGHQALARKRQQLRKVYVMRLLHSKYCVSALSFVSNRYRQH